MKDGECCSSGSMKMSWYCCLGKHAHWLLRLALASVFLYHGLPKLADLTATAAMMQLPVWVATLVALAEVGGSLLLLFAGVFKKSCLTRVAAGMMVPVMVGAIVLVHWPNGWSVGNGGIEFNVVLLAIQLYFVLTGGKSGMMPMMGKNEKGECCGAIEMKDKDGCCGMKDKK